MTNQSSKTEEVPVTSVNQGVEPDGTMFISINQGKTELGLSTFRQNILKRFDNIQRMFDALPNHYINKDGDISLDHSLEVKDLADSDSSLYVKSSKINLDDNIDHDSNEYFGINKKHSQDILVFRDKDDEPILNLICSLNPDGVIELHLATNNPQPGNDGKFSLSSDIILSADKAGNSKLKWNDLELTHSYQYDLDSNIKSENSTFSWNNFKLVSDGSKIVKHTIQPAFLGIMAGSANEVEVEKSSSSNVTVTFAKTVSKYTKPPIVILTPLCDGNYAGDIHAVVESVTQTKFKAVIHNSNTSNNIKVKLQWSAFPSDDDSLDFDTN